MDRVSLGNRRFGPGPAGLGQAAAGEVGVRPLQLRTAPGWTCATEHVAGEDEEDLAKKLKAELPKDPNEHVVSLAILNRLGSQGWEMVTHIKMGNSDFYRFKRPLLPKD